MRSHIRSMSRHRRRNPPGPPSLDPEEHTLCWLCRRALGSRVEWHHPRPKSEGGRRTVPVHPICHRTLHASFTNRELALMEARGEPPGDRDEIAGFLRFIAHKPPDFHAPTRRRRSG